MHRIVMSKVQLYALKPDLPQGVQTLFSYDYFGVFVLNFHLLNIFIVIMTVILVVPAFKQLRPFCERIT